MSDTMYYSTRILYPHWLEHLIEPEQAQSLQSLVHSFPRDFHFWFIAMNLRTSS